VLLQDSLVQVCRGAGLDLGVVEVGQVADRLVDIGWVVGAVELRMAGDDVQRVEILELA